jgi:hypothetical protein
MKVKAFDHLHGAVYKGGVFHVGKPEPKIPDGIAGYLMHHGIDARAMFATGGRFTVNQIDSFFATRDVSPADRMAVKSCLAQLNLLV